MGSILTRENQIFYIFIFLALVTRKSGTLSSASQHVMPREFSGKWEVLVATDCLNTRFPDSLDLPCHVRAQCDSKFVATLESKHLISSKFIYLRIAFTLFRIKYF